MNIERNNSTFIRDLLIKVVLIVIFVFLLTFLFPMPNLTTFYDAVFNNNVQTMKDAAEDWFTTERMPKEVGEQETLTLQDMLDKKLILPFLDKDGNQCDTEKSYVTVKKEENEYILKVYLSCNGKSDYIIEPIGCYNFCPDGKCDTPLVETDEKTGQVKVNIPTNNNVPTNNKVTPSNNVPSNNNVKPNNPVPVTPTDNGDKYKLQYLYTRTLNNGYWTNGNWQNSKEKESSTTKLVDTRVQYTGQKKVEKNKTLYKHVKYAYKDNWTFDTDWTDEVKTLTGNLKLYAKRTLYHGQRKITKTTTKYKHIKYGYKDNWTELEWSTTKRTPSDTVVLTGTRYTVRKPITKKTGSWSEWKNDTEWRTSKPADTSTKQWKGPYDTKTNTSWKIIYNSYSSRTALATYSGNRWNELLYSQMESCTSACGGQSQIRIYYYRVHEKQVSYQYKYQYRTYTEKTTTSVDEKVVTDKDKYIKDGYTVVKTEYKYKINNPEKYIADTVWTDSKTPPTGYLYAKEATTTTVISYENLGKWVTSSSKLEDYTYNTTTRVQYKYRYNTPIKYLESTIWTESKTPPSGYTYTGDTKPSTSSFSYVDLGKWVNSRAELDDYTHNVEKRTQYKYKYYSNNSKTESKWFDSNPGGDWVYANQTRKVKIN